ncbi:hypothetical protein REPUB_Repub13aG0117500 [Reevesia pubescens]
MIKMEKRELMKTSFVLLIAVLLLLSIIMFQCKVASTGRFSWSDDPAFLQVEVRSRTRKLMQGYSGYVPSLGDYDYNDFHRRQGDVPSPGIGH